jgi:hypothetical protein
MKDELSSMDAECSHHMYGVCTEYIHATYMRNAESWHKECAVCGRLLRDGHQG